MVRVPLVGVSLLLHRLQPTMHDPPSPKRGGAPSNTPHRDAATPRKEGASRTAITQHDTRQQRCVQTENLLVSTVSLHVSLNGSDRERRQTTEATGLLTSACRLVGSEHAEKPRGDSSNLLSLGTIRTRDQTASSCQPSQQLSFDSCDSSSMGQSCTRPMPSNGSSIAQTCR